MLAGISQLSGVTMFIFEGLSDSGSEGGSNGNGGFEGGVVGGGFEGGVVGGGSKGGEGNDGEAVGIAGGDSGIKYWQQTNKSFGFGE